MLREVITWTISCPKDSNSSCPKRSVNAKYDNFPIYSAGDNNGYCYRGSDNCHGPHVNGTAVVMREECCGSLGGHCWGKAGRCHICETHSPILPHVIS